MAGEFYISGLSNSGFDYQAFLQKYQELKNIPINLMKQQAKKLSLEKEALSAIKSKLDSIFSPALNLTLETTYETKKATLSNPDIADVFVENSALNGNYSLTVNSLAQANKFRVGTVNTITDINAPISGSGSLVINYLKDGSSQSLTVDYTGKTLKEIVDQINSSGDLEATVINVGTDTSPNYQLIVASKNTGTQNAITSIDDTTNPGDDSAGVFSEDNTKTYETVSAKDASITIDGIDFTSQTNTFNNVLTGVNITVKDIGSSEISISNDFSSIKDDLQQIIDGYNQLKETIRISTSPGQPLRGQSYLNSIASGVFNIINSYLGKYGLIDTIGDAETTKGLLTLNEDALNEFLQREDAKDILQNLGRALETYVSSYSDSLSFQSQRYQEQLVRLEDRINYMNERVNKQIESMRLRFAKLETYLSDMQALQLRIQNFAAGLSGNSNSNNK